MNQRSALRSIAGILALVLVPSLNLAGGGAVRANPPGAPAPPAAAEAVVGTGPWLAKMACVTCIAAGITLGGSSIFLFVAFAVKHAWAAGLCIGACQVGF